MHKLWAVLIALAVVVLVSYQSMCGNTISEDALKIEAEARFIGQGEERKMMLFVRLVNTGKQSITVLTNKDNLDIDTTRDRQTDSVQISLGLDHIIKNQDRLVVPSLYDYSPVTINPNEVASITKFLSDMPEEMMLTIQYRVTKLWGDRFDIWSGTVKTDPFRVSTKEKNISMSLN